MTETGPAGATMSKMTRDSYHRMNRKRGRFERPEDETPDDVADDRTWLRPSRPRCCSPGTTPSAASAASTTTTTRRWRRCRGSRPADLQKRFDEGTAFEADVFDALSGRRRTRSVA